MEQLTFFRAEKLSPRVTGIAGITGELMYLVEGDEQAALIDTGVGLGDLRGFVQGLTAKPVIVLLTHGHVDHAGSASAFDNVYMSPDDKPVLLAHQNRELLDGYVRMFLGEKFSLIQESDYARSSDGNFLPIHPGDTFALGGITLEIFQGRGHTPGSVAILLQEERSLLLGDACNPFTFLFDENSLPVEAYRDVLLRLREETSGRFDRVLLSHGNFVAPREMIDSVIEVCDAIMAGDTDDVPFAFMGSASPGTFIAKAMTFESGSPARADGGLGNVVYNKNRIRKYS